MVSRIQDLQISITSVSITSFDYTSILYTDSNTFIVNMIFTVLL